MRGSCLKTAFPPPTLNFLTLQPAPKVLLTSISRMDKTSGREQTGLTLSLTTGLVTVPLRITRRTGQRTMMQTNSTGTQPILQPV